MIAVLWPVAGYLGALLLGAFAGLVLGARLSRAELREARALRDLAGPPTICAVCAPVVGLLPSRTEGR